MEHTREVTVGNGPSRVTARISMTATLGDENAEKWAAEFGEVTVSLSTGAAHLQTYGDPTEIRVLALALREIANAVDGEDEAIHDELKLLRSRTGW